MPGYPDTRSTDGYSWVMMQRYLLALSLIVLAFVSFSDAQADYTAVKTANELFEAGKLAEAAKRYRSVIERKTESHNGTVAAFNLGNTLFRVNRFAEAADHYRKIAAKPGVPDDVKADSRFNAGNAFARLAMNTEGNKQKKKLLKAALKEYRRALLANPDDQESKINHEIILRLLKQHASPSQTAKSSFSNARQSFIRSNIASNILERSAREEQTVLRNRYLNSSRSKKVGSNRDW